MSSTLLRRLLLPVAVVLVGWSHLAAQPNYQFINAAPNVTATQDSVYFCEDGTFIGDFFGFKPALLRSGEPKGSSDQERPVQRPSRRP